MIYFYDWPWYINGFIIVSLIVFLAILGLIIVRKVIDVKILKENHEVATASFNLIGVLYAVLLGFTVLEVQQHYVDASNLAEQEANLIANLYRDAAIYRAPHKELLRKSLRAYVVDVINVEWKLMAEGKKNDIATILSENVWNVYYAIRPDQVSHQAWFMASVTNLNAWDKARLSRLSSSHQSLSPMLWCLLILGGLINISAPYFFGSNNFRSQIVMTGLIAGSISFMLFLTMSLDNPFRGDQGVKPDALERVLDLFDYWDKIS